MLAIIPKEYYIKPHFNRTFNMRKLSFLIAGLFITSFVASQLVSRSFRVTQIPNGSKNACANCHVSPAGGGVRNNFGQTVENGFLVNGNVMWDAALAQLDSDNDGFSNGTELQDPSGTWRTGQPDPGVLANVSNPGDPLSTPPPTSVKETGEVPLSFSLSDNFPNPFNPSTRIRYSIVEAGQVKLEVYSLLGENIFTLVNGFQPAGSYEVDVTFASAPSGLYLYRLESEGKVLVKKMNLLK